MTCNSSNYCSFCGNSCYLMFDNSGCVSECLAIEGYYKTSKDIPQCGKCSLVLNNCKSCGNDTVCQNCSDGFVLSTK